MSHEIRTPMNAIIGMTELALRTELSVKQRNYLNKIHYAVDSLLNIINDILDFSKIEANKLQLECLPFSLDEVLGYVCDVVEEKAKQKNIVISLLVSANTPRQLIGDSLRLSQVLVNLVSNAVKFTEEGRIIISVNSKESHQQTTQLCFSVRDSGIGMNAEQMADLFLPFRQADSSTTRKYGGTGLGLAISKQLVELMGGQIWVESQLNVGSCFSFIVKLGISSQALSVLKKGAFPLVSNFNGQRVLLVEDNEINRELAFELLTELGLRVEMAVDGKQGVQRATHEVFDLILMDIQMPEMDGLTATRLIRGNPALKDIPIIAMTAHAMSGDREKSLVAGMNDHLTKPINHQKLMEILNYWLKATPSQSVPGQIDNSALTSTRTTAEVPDSLPPFDIPTSLLRMRGNVKLLHKLLLMFHQNYLNTIAELQTMLDANLYVDAKRMVHTLKGVARTLGAEELAFAAAAIEQAIEDQQLEEINLLVALLEAALQPALLAAGSLERL